MRNFSSPDFIEQLRQGNEQAFTEVVEAYTSQIYRASLGLGFDAATANELTQNVWGTFFEAVKNFQGRSHIRTFIFGILYNKAKELRRDFSKHRDHDPIDDIMESKFVDDGHWKENAFMSPEEFVASSQSLEIIEECLDKLPMSQKMAFTMKVVEGEETTNICNILDVSSTNLGVLLYRSRMRLRECIERLTKAS